MVAFVVSFAVTLAGAAAIVIYGKRRPVGAYVTWGEAMAASAFVFFIAFLAYGVVPHQWLTWASNELNWRADRIVEGPGGVVGTLPFTVTWQAIQDLIVVAIYGVMLAIHVGMWVWWQKRGDAKPKEIETSPYGRPLVKKA